MKKASITGVTGQDGSLLLKYLLEKNYEVHGLKRRASSFNTQRIDEFYESNKNLSKNFIIHFSDMIDFGNISRIVNEVKPDEIYHLAAMSHVRVSFDLPLYAGEVNALGTHKILEAVRLSKKKIKFYNASTSELYGDVQETPQTENTPFYPRSPYGVAKLYAHWMTKHYREAYGIFASNGILFNHESEYRGETFVTRKITRGISSIAFGFSDHISLGNLDAKRDWGYADEYVKLMHKILQYDKPDDWVIGTGEIISVRDFIVKSFRYVGVEIKFKGVGINETGFIEKNNGKYENFKPGKTVIKVSKEYFRPTEVELLLADPSKAKEKLNWEPTTNVSQLIERMMKNDLKEFKIKSIVKDKGFFVSNNHLND
jgi:GDPmannose 4,6-dehydratase